MKNILRYLFILTIVFVLPIYGYADEENNFQYIDIDSNITLTYKVGSEERTHEQDLYIDEETPISLELYKINEDGTETKIEFNNETINGEWLIDTEKNIKLYRVSNKNSNTYFDKSLDYKIKYNTNINIDGSNKTITYEKKYSYDENKNSSDDGILINIEDNISPKIKIKKILTKGTPDGLFKFNISGDGVSRDVLVKTENGVGEVDLKDIYLSIDSEYVIKEMEMPDTSYKFVSIESNPENIMIASTEENPNPNDADRSIKIKPNIDTLYTTVEITATNSSKVDHVKEIKDNEDGTYQLSLDITGSANIDSSTAKANILIVFDTSTSMYNFNLNSTYFIKIRDDGETGVEGSSSARYYKTNNDSNGNRIYWVDGVFRTGPNSSYSIYTGPVYVRFTTSNDRGSATELIMHYFVKDLLAYNNLDGNNPSDPNVQLALVKFNGSGTEVCFNANGTVNCNGNNYWTTENSFANWFSYDAQNKRNDSDYARGTNWKAGLDAANTILAKADKDPTYVIFITDGAPTEPDPTGTITDPSNCPTGVNSFYCAALKPARDIQTYNTITHQINSNDSNTTLLGILAFGNNNTGYANGDYLDDLVYYAHTGTQRPLPNGSNSDKERELVKTYDTSGYYNASNPDDLDAAINDIFRTISKALGVGSVSVIDGTTNGVTVSSGAISDEGLLDIDETSYKYYLSMNANKASDTIPTNIQNIANQNSYSFTDNGNGTVRRNNKNLNVYTIARKELNRADEPIDFTIYAIDNEDGTITCIWVDANNNNRFLTLDGDINLITENEATKYIFKYSWTEANAIYPNAPPAAHLDNNKYKVDGEGNFVLDGGGNKIPNPDFGAVKWDLSSLNTLLDGVTYTIKFDVWPSQVALDLIADLKNDPSKYNTLSENIRKYLIEDGHGGYTLYTNTESARIIYEDSRDQEVEIPIPYVNPSPVATDAAKIEVTKNWVNDLDELSDSINLYLKRDETILTDIPFVLTESVNWTDEVYMSAGSVSLEKETNQIIAIIRTNGYDYNFAESGYKWDLVSNQIMHPMLINGVLAILVETSDNVTISDSNILFANNKVYIRINNKKYEVKLKQYNGTDITTSDIPNNSFTVVSTINDNIVTKTLYFNINGVIYEVEDSASNLITITNYRRSNLNLKKVVTGDDPNNTAFRFNLYVKTADGDKPYFSIQNDTGVKGTTAENEEVVIKTVFNVNTNATAEVGSRPLKSNDPNVTELKEVVINGETYLKYKYRGVDYEVKVLTKTIETVDNIEVATYTYLTGYYYFNSEANNIYVYLRNGDNLRITNLPIDSEFRIEEVETTNFKLVNSDVWYNSSTTEKLKEDILDNIFISNDFKTINGSIYTYNRNFWTEYTNDYLRAHIKGIKTWIDNNNAEGKRPNNITVYLKNGNNTITSTTVSSSDNWEYEFIVDRYDANNVEIEYSVDEGPIANYRKVLVDGTYNIINILTINTDIIIKKVWEENGNSIPTGVIVQIYDKDRDIISADNISLSELDKVNNISWSKKLTLPMYYYNEENNTLTKINYDIRELAIMFDDKTNNLTNNMLNVYHGTITNRLLGIWTATYSKDTDGTLIATNTWEAMPTISLVFKKVANVEVDDHGNVLGYTPKSGAVFRLFVYIGDKTTDTNYNKPIDYNNPTSYTGKWVLIGDATSSGEEDIMGLVVFDNLYEGEYRLVEIVAPEGYMLPSGQWRVVVSDDDTNGLQLAITATDASSTPAIINNTISGDTSILIPNYEIPYIPSTGGIGIPHYKTYGLIIMLMSIVTLIINQLITNKKQENNYEGVNK